jgi:general secretion pathway protein D
LRWGLLLAGLSLVLSGPVLAQEDFEGADSLVNLDFPDQELPVVIDAIARMTNKNFIYDERVRGRITIISPTPVSAEQAYAVFESVLQVKGFTTVTTPGGAIKIVPIREAKESSIETVRSSRRPPNRDHFVTRLIPLNYIDAESIVNTLKPLVSKDAAMAAYAPTNTVILTESASNIRRIIQILESIDIETYKEELAVIRIEFADAATLAEQVSDIYGAEVSSAPSSSARRSSSSSRSRRNRATDAAAAAAAGGAAVPVRILTDERTNSLLVLAPRTQLEEVRGLVAKLDVPVEGGGRIHVHYLDNATAEDIAQTLSSLLSGSSSPAGGGSTGAAGTQAASIRSAVASLSDGISVTADPAINALIIQASKEGYTTLREVIQKLDIVRPQVLVEALIMEVDVTDGHSLGFAALMKYINGDMELAFQTATTAGLGGAGAVLPIAVDAVTPLLGFFGNDGGPGNEEGNRDGTLIQGLISATASNGDVNILSAPHILTTDNEQAEIRVGDNIPIITSRVQSAAGQEVGLSSSVNVERQDIGVTLRVTPQITEGETMRMEIFQEITQVNSGLIDDTGDPEQVGLPLSNRRIENTVIVADGETVVIGGLIGDNEQNTVSKVPWLGDIPVLGWAFKTTSTRVTKQNLLVFLTPHIVRSAEDLERKTIEKREEFREGSGKGLALSDEQLEEEALRLARAEAEGTPYEPEYGPGRMRGTVAGHAARYPRSRIGEIERAERERAEAAEAAATSADEVRYFLQAGIFEDSDAAATLLTDLFNSGHDGTLVSADSGGTLLHEVHVGPYSSLRMARQVGEAIQRSHDVDPVVIVVESDEQE